MARHVPGDGFDDFYDATHVRTTALVFTIVNDFAEAEDLTQEAYARLLPRWQDISAYEQPEAWVRRVAVNLALNVRRRLGRQAKHLMRLSQPETTSDSFTGWIGMRDVLRSLPRHYRAVLVLHYVVGLSLDEVADELSIPVNTARSRLRRGRTALRTLLEDQPDNAGTPRGAHRGA